MGITLTTALRKWKKVTNDGGKTVYSTNKDGTILMHTYGAGGGFRPTIDLFTSIGWEEYVEPIITPERVYKWGLFSYISEYGKVVNTHECPSIEVDTLFREYNYFTDSKLAQYIADKQFIQRANILLEHINKNNPDKKVLVANYIKANHKEIIDRIRQYEEEEGI